MLISLVNGKGGVGKSTLAVHLAVWLRERGFQVLAIDADPQQSLTQWLAKAAPEIAVFPLTDASTLLTRTPRIMNSADVVVADAPAGFGHVAAALIASADLVWLPIGASMLDIWASYRTARMIYQVRFRNQNRRPAACTILNRVDANSNLTRVAAAAARKYGFPIALQPIQARSAFVEACGEGTVVWKLGSRAKHATREVTRLFETLLPQAMNNSTTDGAPPVVDFQVHEDRSVPSFSN